ncbi:MAG TPA: phosphopantetheine-binding protein [Polyangiaceae bacterium]|jgi:acetyltransferase-like isoleucine patch superfamily enzyme
MKNATLLERAAARVHLRAADALGQDARTQGKPFVQNRGELAIGDHFRIASRPVQSHLVVARGARLVIGRDVAIGSAAAISCSSEITIGDGVRIGRGVVIMDSDFHDTESMGSPGASAAIVIGAGACIGDEVVILKGARIGDGARIAAASVVSGIVPAGALASGVPARVRRDATAPSGDVETRVVAIVAATFDVDHVDPADGPATLAHWDSLGALRLLVALEEDLGVRLAEDALSGVADVASLVRVVESARA